jgi:hypothetical protein
MKLRIYIKFAINAYIGKRLSCVSVCVCTHMTDVRVYTLCMRLLHFLFYYFFFTVTAPIPSVFPFLSLYFTDIKTIPYVTFSLYGPLYIHSFTTLLSHSFHVTEWPFKVDTAKWFWIHWRYSEFCGPGSIVGIATGYRLDSVGIKSQWGGGGGADFPHLSRLALRPTQPPVQWVPGLYWGGKEQQGRDADPSPLLVLWSCKSRAIPLITQWVVQPVRSLSACTRLNFTFIFTQKNWT